MFSIGCTLNYEPCGANSDNEDVSTDGKMCNMRLVRTLTVSKEFTPAQTNNIELAATWWNQAIPGRVKLSVMPTDGQADIFLNNDMRPGLWAFEDKGYIDVRPSTMSLTDHEITSIIAHEIGHTFGLGHSEDESAIMRPVLTPNMYISEDDVNHFNKVASEGIY